MSVRNPFTVVLALAAVALLGACATAPQPLQGNFLAVTPEQAVAGQQIGAAVRWGGRIVETKPGPDGTCFQVVATPLNATGRPDSDNADAGQGRFIACRAGFYDPAIFTSERDVTITGRIVDFETRRIGDFDYRYPRLDAEVIYLWPERLPQDRIYFQDPFWPGYYGGWGFRAPILVRPAPKSEPAPPPKS